MRRRCGATRLRHTQNSVADRRHRSVGKPQGLLSAELLMTMPSISRKDSNMPASTPPKQGCRLHTIRIGRISVQFVFHDWAFLESLRTNPENLSSCRWHTKLSAKGHMSGRHKNPQCSCCRSPVEVISCGVGFCRKAPRRGTRRWRAEPLRTTILIPLTITSNFQPNGTCKQQDRNQKKDR